MVIKIFPFSILFFVLACLPLSLFAQDKREPFVEGMGWLAGCWELKAANGKSVTTEQWMKPSAGTMIGMSRTVSGGRMVAWEFMRIVTESDGISYIAKPHTNKEETSFRLAKAMPSEVIFENAAHDFPQRIIYRSSGTDSLTARIEGTKNGKVSGVDFPMKRVKCEL